MATRNCRCQDYRRRKKLAQPGGISDLKAAIAKLQTVPPYNPRGQEVTTLIGALSRQLQQQEDRPYLEKAEKLASFGDISSIQAAIDEASQIGRGRTLYEEAQQKIKSGHKQFNVIKIDQFLIMQNA